MTSPFCEYLRERWRAHLFNDVIFPGFPFRPPRWIAIAFNRDTCGNVRIPIGVWRALILAVRDNATDRRVFIMSPEPLTGGTVSAQEQPFVVDVDESSLLAHFGNADRYLPAFYMAGGSESWAVWGDSDFTILGGTPRLMVQVIDSVGGTDGLIRAMLEDFRVTSETCDDEMRKYLTNLISRSQHLD